MTLMRMQRQAHRTYHDVAERTGRRNAASVTHFAAQQRQWICQRAILDVAWCVGPVSMHWRGGVGAGKAACFTGQGESDRNPTVDLKRDFAST